MKPDSQAHQADSTRSVNDLSQSLRLGNELIEPVASARAVGAIRRPPRLGGLLTYYHNAA